MSIINYKSTENRRDIIEILKSNKEGQSNEAIILNYVLMMTPYYTVNKRHLTLLNDEEAKPIFEAAIEMSLQSLNKLLEKKNGESLLSLIMDFSNMIKNTYMDDNGILTSKIEELSDGQEGGGIQLFFYLFLLLFILYLSRQLVPRMFDDLVDEGKQQVGNVQKKMKNFVEQNPEMVKMRADLKKIDEGEKGIQKIIIEGQDIVLAAKDLRQKKATWIGAVGNLILSDVDVKIDLDKRRGVLIKDINAWLKQLNNFQKNYKKSTNQELKNEAQVKLNKILGHDYAMALNLKSEDDLFHFLALFAGVENTKLFSQSEQIDAVFLLFNNKNIWYQNVNIDGKKTRVCQAKSEKEVGDETNEVGDGPSECVNAEYDNLHPKLKSKYNLLQIDMKKEPKGFMGFFESKSQPKLKNMGENLFRVSKNTLGEVFISLAPREGDVIKTVEMNNALNIVSELQTGDMENLKLSIANIDDDTFYTTTNGNKLVINQEKLEEFIQILSNLDMKLNEVINWMQKYMHTDKEKDTWRLLGAKRVQKLAQDDVEKGIKVPSIKDGQTITDYIQLVEGMTNGRYDVEQYNAIMEKTKKEVEEVTTMLSAAAATTLASKNKRTFKKKYIKELIKKKITEGIELDQNNLDNAIDAAFKKTEEYNAAANEKVSADDDDGLGLDGGRRATKKRRKRNTTRNKHKAPRKTKSSRRKTTRKKRVSKK